jgi:signal transduction histidine kinase
MVSFGRVVRWVRTWPPRVSAVVVVAVVAVFTASDIAVNDPEYRQDDWFSWLLLGISLLALLWRRRYPVPVALVTGAACAGWALYGHIGELLNLPVIVALYTVARHGDRRRTVVTGAVAAAVSGAVALEVGRDVVNPQGMPLLEMIWPLLPLLLGEVVRTRGELLREYAERAARAEADREREAARRVRAERARIARELHDIVAHTVSGMTVQAGLALDALDRKPEVAREAMRQVRASGKEAVRELRTTLAVLREEPGSTAPAPQLAQLEELAERATADGVRVSLHREPPGALPAVPAAVQLAAYRIVQEALTNVVRHSGARHAAVSVTAARGRLLVEVVDDGPPHDPPGAGGFGLIGMRERAAAVGGELEYGPRSAGGFRVRAALPAAGADR